MSLKGGFENDKMFMRQHRTTRHCRAITPTDALPCSKEQVKDITKGLGLVRGNEDLGPQFTVSLAWMGQR